MENNRINIPVEWFNYVYNKNPSLFVCSKRKVTCTRPGMWGDEQYTEERTYSEGHDLLSTAHAIMIKYGEERAFKYIKNYFKK